MYHGNRPTRSSLESDDKIDPVLRDPFFPASNLEASSMGEWSEKPSQANYAFFPQSSDVDLLQGSSKRYINMSEIQNYSPDQNFTLSAATMGGEIPRLNTIHPLSSFYDTDGPWYPIVSQSNIRSQYQHHPNVPTPMFSGFRNDVPSEVESVATHSHFSDSGYVTRSVATASVISGCEPGEFSDDVSLVGRMGGIDFMDQSREEPHHANFVPGVHLNDTTSQSNRTEFLAPPPAGDTKCKYCDVICRTKSEFKKHISRHELPNRCDFADCKSAFATPNDLDRHKKSVHKLGGSTKSYVCAVPNCRSKGKVWPRKDNFQKHIEKVHQRTGDLDELLRRSEVDGNTAASSLSRKDELDDQDAEYELDSTSNFGFGGGDDLISDLKETRDLNQMKTEGHDLAMGIPLMRTPSRDVSGQELMLSPLPGDHVNSNALFSIYNGNGGTSLSFDPAIPGLSSLDSAFQGTGLELANPQRNLNVPSVRITRDQNSEMFDFMGSHSTDPTYTMDSKMPDQAFEAQIPDARTGQKTDIEEAVHDYLESETDSLLSLLTSDPSNSEIRRLAGIIEEQIPNGPRDLQSLLSNPYFRRVIEAGLEKLKDGPNPDQGQTEMNSSPRTGRRPKKLKCKVCGKVKNRPCDMRKHMKRHDRPYGCTHPHCSREFGSKGDWKRHENTQHFQLETWRCQQPSAAASGSGGDCGHAYYRREDFVAHLKNNHGFVDEFLIKDEASRSRISRNHQTSFWCGFCCKIIALERKGPAVERWNSRFDHVGQHFSAGLRITKWVDVDKVAPRGEVPSDDGYDDEEDSTPVDEDEEEFLRAKNRLGIANSLATGQVDLKRKFGHEGDNAAASRPSKRISQDQTFQQWYCCGCNHGPHSVDVDVSCVNCEHRFTGCPNCHVAAESLLC